MKRFNSNPSLKSSIILGGNLNDNLIRNIASLDASSDGEELEEDDCEAEDVESGPSSFDDEGR